MSAGRKRASPHDARGEGISAWAILRELLVETIGDERRADVLLSSALAASHQESPPTSADAVLSFAKTHLHRLLRDEIGARIAVALIAEVESRLSASEPPPVKESGRRRRDDRDSIPAPSLPPLAPAVPPMRKKLPSITGDERRPVALLVGANALERSALARALVQAGLDVRSIEAAGALATVLRGGAVVRLAIVDVDRDDADSILSALVASRPDLPIVARTFRAEETIDAARFARLRVVYSYARNRPPPDVIERICECAMRDDPARFARVPRLIIALEDVGWFNLDADAAALVYNIDGEADLETVARRCGIAPEQALQIARALVPQGLIVLD